MRPGALLARLRRGTELPEPEAERGPAPEPTGADPETSLLVSWGEAVELVRARRGDVFEIQFLGREYDRLRQSEDPALASKLAAARDRLQAVVEQRLRAKGLLAEGGRLELVDAP